MGDLRTENLVVQLDMYGNYKLTSILDWESGFHPDCFECSKATSKHVKLGRE